MSDTIATTNTISVTPSTTTTTTTVSNTSYPNYINRDYMDAWTFGKWVVHKTPKVGTKDKKYSGVLPNGTYIKEVIYSNPATIVMWSDGTKTVSKCHASDTYSYETGLSICIAKKLLGNSKVHKLFDDWLPEQYGLLKNKVTLRDVIKKNKR